MSAELAGLAGIFLFAAAWEIAGMRDGARVRLGGPGPIAAAEVRSALAERLGVHRRLARAGMAERMSVASFMRAKAAASLCGLGVGLLAAPAAPGRLGPAVLAGLVAGGFLAPDAWVQRIAHRRRDELVGALPDALDLVAVGVATGRTPVALFGEIAQGATGALAGELALAVAQIESGSTQTAALASLRERTGTPELGALAAAIERSRRYGSPLSEQLHAQAATLRGEERRRIEERAARAAPKIQLVVAMVLVPSALLAIVAALIAHSDELFAAI